MAARSEALDILHQLGARPVVELMDERLPSAARKFSSDVLSEGRSGATAEATTDS